MPIFGCWKRCRANFNRDSVRRGLFAVFLMIATASQTAIANIHLPVDTSGSLGQEAVYSSDQPENSGASIAAGAADIGSADLDRVNRPTINPHGGDGDYREISSPTNWTGISDIHIPWTIWLFGVAIGLMLCACARDWINNLNI